ncbi:winged helix-turn-helix domain-containing protein [Paramicrobacterium fandaimingii]|uniref:winged helix-turn-helix domain-containing protein n=1 Tax=Paramicrobacterium fandaimingii TaxID=2708079 RepID=UPI001421FD09|nr:transcriptional regulator [Microbacterium fandaimingii]
MTARDVHHPRHRLDVELQNPIRLSILAALRRAGTLGFAEVRDLIEVSDSALSKHASALEQTRYVRVGKTFVGKRPRTTFTITRAGRDALQHHMAALTQIAEIDED